MLAGAAVAFLAATAAFVDLNSRVDFEVFVDHDSEAERGKRFLEREFGVGPPNLLLLFTVKSGTVDGAAAAAEARTVVERLGRERDVGDVASYWTRDRRPGLRSENGRRAIAVARIRGDEKHVDERIRDLAPRYRRPGRAIDVGVGGSAEFLREGTDTSKRDLLHAELATAPITLIALLVVFGSLVAALMPLGMAAVSVVGTGALLWALSFLAPISAFALFFTTILGLGLAIDYSLFVVSRFREELAAGQDVEEAVVRTVETAGRTVLFSATAVAVALAGLLLLPLNVMRSIGFAGVGTAAVAGIAALVVLPALLAVLGPNVNRFAIRGRSLRPGADGGFWQRTAVRVMRRPLTVATAVIAALLIAGIPSLHLDTGLVDDRTFDQDAESRRLGDILRAEFTGREGTPIPVVLPAATAGPEDPGARLGRFARRLAEVGGVSRVETATGNYSAGGRTRPPPGAARAYTRNGSAWLSVVSEREPLSEESDRQIAEMRALPSGFDRVLVTGEAANTKDVTESLTAALPRTLAFIALASFLALLVQFGSVLVPMIAIALTALSLSAMFGALVLIFQDGRLSGLLDFTTVGSFDANVPIVILCFAFGLAMDYQVFILSRIKEEYDRSGDNTGAIAIGLGRSGPIITAAAVLIALVFLSMGIFSTMFDSKVVGFGLGLVVLLDAFVIRATLVPALMKLAGPANWWAPSWLRRLSDRVKA